MRLDRPVLEGEFVHPRPRRRQVLGGAGLELGAGPGGEGGRPVGPGGQQLRRGGTGARLQVEEHGVGRPGEAPQPLQLELRIEFGGEAQPRRARHLRHQVEVAAETLAGASLCPVSPPCLKSKTWTSHGAVAQPEAGEERGRSAPVSPASTKRPSRSSSRAAASCGSASPKVLADWSLRSASKTARKVSVLGSLPVWP